MGLQAVASAARGNHQRFSACCVHTPQRRPRPFHQRHVRVSCLEIWEGLGVSAHSAAGLSGCAPRAVFAVTAIRLQSLTPSRLRRCALRLPPGESPAGYPRRAQLGAPQTPPNRLRRIGLASAPPRWTGRWRTRWRLLQQVARMRAVLNAGGSCPSRHEGRFTDNPPGIAMELPHHASTPAPQGVVEAFSPVVAGLTSPASEGEPEKPSGGDAESAPSPFGAVRPKASLCCCESWRWRG